MPPLVLVKCTKNSLHNMTKITSHGSMAAHH